MPNPSPENMTTEELLTEYKANLTNAMEALARARQCDDLGEGGLRDAFLATLEELTNRNTALMAELLLRY